MVDNFFSDYLVSVRAFAVLPNNDFLPLLSRVLVPVFILSVPPDMRLARVWLLVTRARYVSASAACDSVTVALRPGVVQPSALQQICLYVRPYYIIIICCVLSTPLYVGR